MILSPLRDEVVAVSGSISNCDDHFNGGRLSASVMVDGQAKRELRRRSESEAAWWRLELVALHP